MRRLVLADPGIEIATGHDYAHACTIGKECARRGVPLEVLASIKADPQIVSALGCRTLFRVGLYDRPGFRHPAHALAAYVSWSRTYRQDFSAALDGRVGADDLLLLNTVTISVLKGFAVWLAGRPAGERPATAVMLRLGVEEGLPRFALPGLSRVLYRRVLDRLHRILGPRLLLGTDTRLIGEDFERLIGKAVAPVPLPISVPEPVPPQCQPRSVHLVFPTAATSEKGFHLLPDAFAASLAAVPDLTATIRVANPRRSYAPLVDRLRAMAPRVRILEGALDDARFYGLLCRADAVLLPYDPRVFAKRSSN
jgi:hypothetical protein